MRFGTNPYHENVVFRNAARALVVASLAAAVALPAAPASAHPRGRHMAHPHSVFASTSQRHV